MADATPLPGRGRARARRDAGSVVEAYRALKPYTIQAMVTRGTDWDGSSDASVAARLPRLEKVPRERLEEMARPIREALPQCDVEVF
jgi:hypothetical protein